MAKLALSNLASLANETSAINTINNNSALIETALENTLSRDGTTPNTMTANIDMNSNDLLNVGVVSATQVKVGGIDAALLGDVTVRGAWLTATTYVQLDLVTEAGSTYICLEDHTSGTFLTDLAANKWAVIEANYDPSAVAITGGTITGITDLAVADGGTGASDAATARSNLGAIAELVEDTTPQLGGNLNLNGNVITGLPSTIYGHNGSLAPHENLIITNNSTNPAYQVDVDADVFVVTNSAGEQVRLTSVNLTADITTSGANGLDTGTESSSTWYHIWIIYNGTTTSALLSTATAFGSLTLPSGYTYAGYAGAIRNTSGSDFYELKQIDKIVAARSTEVLNAGAATTYTTVDISGVVPPTAKNVGTVLGVVNLSGTNGTLEVRSGGVNAQNLNRVLHAITAVGATAVGNYNYAAFPHITAGQLEYQVNTAAIDGYIYVIGWEY